MVNQRRDYISVLILFLVNLVNNIDRYTIAGVLSDVQKYYSINDSMGGMIQTVFLISFMIASPICGYLGDRYNRKYVMFTGMIIWLICVCASTFIPSNQFPLFLLFRSLVGIGEASYVNICPTMISDMFTSDKRTRVYMFFYLAVPVGSGLGYIISSNVAVLTHSWNWGIRITGVFGIIALFLLFFFVYEPERGAAEKAEGKEIIKHDKSYIRDLKVLIRCPTYIIATLAYTALVFVSGTLTWWLPTIISYSIAWSRGYPTVTDLPNNLKNEVGVTFGIITTVGGIGGVLLGNILAQCLLYGWCGPFFKTKRAHLISAGVGASFAVPCLTVTFLFGHKSEILTWIMVAISLVGLCFNWSLNVEAYNQIIAPERRSTAFSYVTLISHLCGDASGPYIIGAISDLIQAQHEDTSEWEYKSLAYASMVSPCMMALSTILYWLAAVTFKRDSKKLIKELKATNIDRIKCSYDNMDATLNDAKH